MIGVSFFNKYLTKHGVDSQELEQTPAEDLGLIIVIPCYDEPDILEVLSRLKACTPPICSVEVVVVVNSSEKTPMEVVERNRMTVASITEFGATHNSEKWHFDVILREGIRKKHAGVGMARKVGMDLAVSRFNALENPSGIIVSLDADCTFDPNYLVEVEKAFAAHPKWNGATIQFNHPLSGEDFHESVFVAITRYELYLRYYRQALKYTGFPYAYHTVGSCFAVRAEAYVKCGGMNRKQGGEDFYFLQKLIPNGAFGEITKPLVYPSPRPSLRVPFGTGPMVNRLANGENQGLLTYEWEAFSQLKEVLDGVEHLFEMNREEVVLWVEDLPESVKWFLKSDNFMGLWEETRSHASRLETFKKRFFHNFNAFKILKFLNQTHQAGYYQEQPVETGALKLLEAIKGTPFNQETKELLMAYRELEQRE